MPWHRLAQALLQDAFSIDEVGTVIRQTPTPAKMIEELRVAAETQLWNEPRQSWALATVAYTAAQTWHHPPFLQAQCALTIGTSLNLLGDFTQSLAVLSPAGSIFTVQGDWEAHTRCQSEIALAFIYLGAFEAAALALRQALPIRGASDNKNSAYRNRVEALWWLEQNNHAEAIRYLQAAVSTLALSNNYLELALVYYDLAKSQRFSNLQAAQATYEQATSLPKVSHSSVLQAHRAHTLALVQLEAHPTSDTLEQCQHAKHLFTQRGMHFMSAECDVIEALIYDRQHRYSEAMTCYYKAKKEFQRLGLSAQSNRCDLNLALIHQVHYRYDEALDLYSQVIERETKHAHRPFRIALCHTNMGLCYEHLGRYDLSLTAHMRALELYTNIGSPLYYTGHCHENLAGTYRALGRYAHALDHYQQALDCFQKDNHRVHTASHHTQVAELYLLLNRYTEAELYLQKACTIYSAEGLLASLATCKRLHAEVAYQQGHCDRALTYLSEARLLFQQQTIVLGAALCDLIEGEILIATRAFDKAMPLLLGLRDTLFPGFPDHAWRVELGLGRCAKAIGEPYMALSHYSDSISWLSKARASLPTERLRSDFYVRRQHVFQEGVVLGVDVGLDTVAFQFVEASKSHAQLTKYHPFRQHENDPFESNLIRQERMLREQIESLRTYLIPPEHDLLPLAVEATQRSQTDALASLNQLCLEYEEIVEQLRVATSHPSVITDTTFDIKAFRESAKEQLGTQWGCLEYFLVEDELIIFYLDTQDLRVHQVKLDRWTKESLLHQATSNEPERRELIYGGTFHGHSMAKERGERCRTELGRLLFPPEIVDLSLVDLLIIVPHGLLFHLPFHALFVKPKTLLLEQVAVVYSPSLHVLQNLCQRAGTRSLTPQTFVWGLDTFKDGARPLPYARAEAEMIAEIMGEEAQLFTGSHATVATLKTLNTRGELARCTLLHFATHALALPRTPMLSRILLSDTDLTVADILGLDISARLVTLSACQAAQGEVAPGDEIMSLAQAFFHAGASGVVASLWAVEDQATNLLMKYFYHQLQEGVSIPHALRSAQLRMHREGFSAYQWAPFLAIGCP